MVILIFLPFSPGVWMLSKKWILIRGVRRTPGSEGWGEKQAGLEEWGLFSFISLLSFSALLLKVWSLGKCYWDHMQITKHNRQIENLCVIHCYQYRSHKPSILLVPPLSICRMPTMCQSMCQVLETHENKTHISFPSLCFGGKIDVESSHFNIFIYKHIYIYICIPGHNWGI